MNARVRSGVCVGWLRHRRSTPVKHAFTYPLFMVLLDIDRIPEAMAASSFTSYNRWNWASFHESDHFGDSSQPLRKRLASDAASHGLTLPDGPVFLLTHLRYLGYCFNPVSFFYCYDGGGSLRLVLAEVSNTFGGTHNYWLEPEVSGAGGTGGVAGAAQAGPLGAAGHQARVFRASAAKSFYVSPFMPADMSYSFSFTEPNDRLVVHMTLEHAGAADTSHAFDATLGLDVRPWTSREVRRALLRHPLMTATVVAGIHWEALNLWLKGLTTVARPTPNGEYPDCAASQAAAAMGKR